MEWRCSRRQQSTVTQRPCAVCSFEEECEQHKLRTRGECYESGFRECWPDGLRPNNGGDGDDEEVRSGSVTDVLVNAARMRQDAAEDVPLIQDMKDLNKRLCAFKPLTAAFNARHRFAEVTLC